VVIREDGFHLSPVRLLPAGYGADPLLRENNRSTGRTISNQTNSTGQAYQPTEIIQKK
jgi:hypothetical protein